MRTIFATVLAVFEIVGKSWARLVDCVQKIEADARAHDHVIVAQCGTSLCLIIAQTLNTTGEYKVENIGKRLGQNMTSAGCKPN